MAITSFEQAVQHQVDQKSTKELMLRLIDAHISELRRMIGGYADRRLVEMVETRDESKLDVLKHWAWCVVELRGLRERVVAMKYDNDPDLYCEIDEVVGPPCMGFHHFEVEMATHEQSEIRYARWSFEREIEGAADKYEARGAALIQWRKLGESERAERRHFIDNFCARDLLADRLYKCQCGHGIRTTSFEEWKAFRIKHQDHKAPTSECFYSDTDDAKPFTKEMTIDAMSKIAEEHRATLYRAGEELGREWCESIHKMMRDEVIKQAPATKHIEVGVDMGDSMDRTVIQKMLVIDGVSELVKFYIE